MSELDNLLNKIIAMSFAIPKDMLITQDGTYAYYKSIFDEADKRQTPWGRIMSDIATQQLAREEGDGSKAKAR